MIGRSRTLWALTAAAGGLMLTGCGEAPDDTPPTQITVAVRPQGANGPVDRWQLSCPARTQRPVCRRLQTTTREHFAPVPEQAICTAVYGGPATATVQGRLRARGLRARFELRNGCEIARWRRFAWLIGEPPRETFKPRTRE